MWRRPGSACSGSLFSARWTISSISGSRPGTTDGKRRRLARQHLAFDLPRVGAGKRFAVREQLVAHGADGEDVAAVIDFAAFDLLRRHVAGRADHHVDLRQRQPTRVLLSSATRAIPKSRIFSRPC